MRGCTVRALLLKPAALGAAIGLALFGVAMLFVSSLAAHASIADSSSDCGSPPATSTVLTSSNNASTSGGTIATTLSTNAVESASQSSASDDDSPSPTPSDSSSPTDSPSPTDTPTTSDSSSTDATSPDPTTSSSTSAGVSSDLDSTSPSPTPSDSSSPSPSPTPSSSPSPAPTAQLCVLVQSYPASGDALAGDQASYVVWAWSMDADSSDVLLTASVPAASYLGTPAFSICPSASGATCTMASLPVGQAYELLASVPVTSDAPVGTDIDLTVTATSTGDLSESSDAIDTVVSASAAASSSSSTDTTSGSGANEVPPLISLPPIPGTGVTATNPADLFPTVSPSEGTVTLPQAQSPHRAAAHATETTSYAVPVDPRLLGAQIVGLAALVGAVTIAIVRLSLRKPQVAPSAPAEPAEPPAAS
jgi:hypothetical protein